VSEVRADWGRGFQLCKIDLMADGGEYHVNLNGNRSTCDCKGHLKWGHCKHVDALAVLSGCGLI
jgi:hypothetical protein